ncbi:DUF1156 domain-containing protein [Blastococcus sp. TF02-8]|uniref:DUF1156 domain-containing protein n=1 Tax=Blastococcus sp. TF02-8 TaxID=2250574 RepID=UPI001F0BF7AD|nr:hypothetical protein [Blastococcus sp. TF02-8]
MERLSVWENLQDEGLLAAARAEIRRSTGDSPPAILDPFAGGGSIPLEAQRLGLRAHASDLNPVSVLINTALMDIPSRFQDVPPVFPGAADSRMGTWPRATGIAEDIRRYGGYLRDQAQKRIGHLYPEVSLPDGSRGTAMAWVWARTVRCPNPACSVTMPLTNKWSLGRKKGKEAYVQPEVTGGEVRFKIGTAPPKLPFAQEGTVTRNGAVCVACGSTADLPYIREEAKGDRMGETLLATVVEGRRRRIYVEPDSTQQAAGAVPRPANGPSGDLPTQALGFRVQAYGMKKFADLFSNRQLSSLICFTDLVIEVRSKVVADAVSAGMPLGAPLSQGGNGAEAYGDAISTYLAFVVSRLSDYQSYITTWASNPQMEILRNAFARQAVPMTWDFAEGNPFADSSGSLNIMTRAVARVVDLLPAGVAPVVLQGDAAANIDAGLVISTDPPYYDNIGYSDLSDFFYIWLRRALREVHPDALGTLLVPKAQELVANPFRHGGRDGAQDFFESGFRSFFSTARFTASADYPITVYYAFKQTETDQDGESSTGWETLLSAMMASGWQITGTWPMRSERGGRMTSVGSNTLASSIVLALRPRADEATVVDRRTFTAQLRDELPIRLRELQQGSIAPVDLPQAAIGPGMAVFSRYVKVVEADGQAMTVRAALQIVNQILGEVLSAQEGDFDSGTRWCVKWFESYGFDAGPYGEAETIASAFNTSVGGLDRSGALTARAGKVQLFDPAALRVGYDPRADDHITLWEIVVHLAKALDEQGLDAAGLLMARAAARIDLDAAKELAYLLFSIAERNRWSGVAQRFNMLAASWADVLDAARSAPDASGEQLVLDTAY